MEFAGDNFEKPGQIIRTESYKTGIKPNENSRREGNKEKQMTPSFLNRVKPVRAVG